MTKGIIRMEPKAGELFSYDEIFISTEAMRKYFRFMGLLPFIHRREKNNGAYVASWRKWQPLMCSQALLATVFAIYSTFVDLIAFIPGSEMERHVMRAIALIFLLDNLINLSCFIFLVKPNWTRFFRRWAQLDALLDIRYDAPLRRLARRMVTAFTGYVICLLIVSAFTGLWLLLRPHDLFMGPTYPFALFVFSFHWSICLILPEVFVVFVCSAICERLNALCQQLTLVFNQRSLPLAQRKGEQAVERLRVAYQLLMDSVAHVNRVFGPFLLTTCLFHVLPLPLIIYSFVEQGRTNMIMKLLKMSVFATNFARVAVMCVVGQKVHDRIKEVFAVLRDAPSNALSEDTNHEISFFMNCTRLSSTKISAWGFFEVDIGYLQSVLGMIVAYTITIMQLETAVCPSLLLPADNNDTNGFLPASNFSTDGL